MKKEHEWIKKYDCLTINKKKYWFRADFVMGKKAPNIMFPAMILTFQLYEDGKGFLYWDDFKGTYLAEKLTVYVKNTLNGQRSFYWNNDEPQKFN